MKTQEESASGPQKVAAFLLSLEKNAAANLLKHLGEDVLAEVAEAMTALNEGLARPDGVDGLWRELARHVNGKQRLRPSDEQQLGELLRTSVGAQRANEVLARIRERRLHERPFLVLEKEAPDVLGRLLALESPAVAALVLAHLDPETSAVVLGTFEADRALDVVARMAALTPPGFDTLQVIAADLAGRLAALRSGPAVPDPSRRLKTIAEMLSHTREEVERQVLTGLAERDEEVAKEIREFLFTWEDIGSVDKRSMQKILGSVDTRTLSMALKACSVDVEKNVMDNLSQRVRDMVKDERELIGAVPMSDVLAARTEIMNTVRTLMESGEFRPSRSGQDLVT